MKSSIAAHLALAVVTLAATAPLAAAQPGPPQPTDPSEPTEPTEPSEPAPPPPPPERQPPADTAMMPAPAAPTGRPDGFSIGIGLGYDLPTSLQAPNVTSVRFRLPSGLTFEPQLTLGGTVVSNDDGNGNTTSNKQTELSLAAVVRLPRRVHDRVDLVFLGAAGLGVAVTNPQGDNNDTSTSELSLAWGLGLDYWIGPHWVVSLAATNPLLRSVRTSQQSPVGGNDATTTTTSFGLIFDPNVVLMAHLFF